MWAKLNDAGDTIEELIQHPKSMTIDGIRHPRQMFKWTTSELKAVGIVPVTTSGSHLNIAYYIETDEAFAIAGDKNSVVRTIGVKVADKKLADEDAKDEEGNQLLHDDGSKVINYGLKHNAIQKVKTQQAGFLSQTDWYIIRKADAGTAIPSNIQTWRDAIRVDATEIETAITNAADMDAFIALHNDTYKGDGSVDVVARVNRWTELGT